MRHHVRLGDTILSGGCPTGADAFGEEFAALNPGRTAPNGEHTDLNLTLEVFPADWKRFKRAAGPIRNEEMAKSGDRLLALWDGESRGTMSMIRLALKHGLDVHVYIFRNGVKTHGKEV